MRFPKTQTGRSCAIRGAALGLAITFPVALGMGQNASNGNQHPDSIIIPAANPTPDANDRMRMREQQKRRVNFDKANALRRKQIDDDALKLLVLANDLKQQLDKLGNSDALPQLQREAAVVELLARDVQMRMTMTVGRE
jgi:hypothetical protein